MRPTGAPPKKDARVLGPPQRAHPRPHLSGGPPSPGGRGVPRYVAISHTPYQKSYFFFGFRYFINPWNQITSAGLPLIWMVLS